MIKHSLLAVKKTPYYFRYLQSSLGRPDGAERILIYPVRSGTPNTQKTKTKTKPTHNFSRIDFSLFFRRVVIFL